MEDRYKFRAKDIDDNQRVYGSYCKKKVGSSYVKSMKHPTRMKYFEKAIDSCYCKKI